MFRIVRLIIILLSIATTILSIFALVGSYKNEAYLTKIYLLDFHLTDLDVSQLIDFNGFSKRDTIQPDSKRDTILPDRTVVEKDLASSLSDIGSTVSGIVNSITYEDMGLAQVYSISLWGYCKGEVKGSSKTEKGFDNSDIDFKWCSDPKPAYYFDPLEIIKHELNNTINDKITGASGSIDISSDVRTVLEQIVDNITYETLNLPGNLNKQLTLLNNLTKASFALILIMAILSAIGVFVQLIGCCVDPSNCCLSCINFLFQTLVFLTGIIGAGLATGAYIYVRKQINENTGELGIKSFLSIAFYALIWSAVAAALLVLIFTIIGHCCGCFSNNRKKYKPLDAPAVPEKNGYEMGYNHHQNY